MTADNPNLNSEARIAYLIYDLGIRLRLDQMSELQDRFWSVDASLSESERKAFYDELYNRIQSDIRTKGLIAQLPDNPLPAQNTSGLSGQ